MGRIVWVLLLVVAAGCASPPLAKQVQAQDWAGVERGVREAEARGEWTAQDTRDLAQRILEVEIDAAPGTAAKQWIPGLRGCASAVLPALKARAQKSDATAAAITRILIESDAVSLDGLVGEHGASTDAALGQPTRDRRAPDQHERRPRVGRVGPDGQITLLTVDPLPAPSPHAPWLAGGVLTTEDEVTP